MTAAEAARRESARLKAQRCALAKCPLAGKGDERCAKCTGPVAWTDGRGRRTGRGGKTHLKCSSCPMDGLGLPVCWAGCDGPAELTSDGESLVRLGGMAGQDGADAYIESRMAQEARLARLPRDGGVTRFPPQTEAALLELLRVFADMTPAQVLVLHAKLNGRETMVETARQRGITKQAVSKAVARLAMRHPRLAAFLGRRGEASA